MPLAGHAAAGARRCLPAGCSCGCWHNGWQPPVPPETPAKPPLQAVVNNRKNKIIAAYELAVVVAWRGAAPDGTEVTGAACWAVPQPRPRLRRCWGCLRCAAVWLSGLPQPAVRTNPHQPCARPELSTALNAGEVRLPYISEENHDEDPEMQVGAVGSTAVGWWPGWLLSQA